MRAMFRRVVATLLVLGWISLSGFDVVEDLDEAPGQVAISRAPADSGPGSKRGGLGPLANNIIESASRTKQISIIPVNLRPTTFSTESLTEFRKHSQIHKLLHVFLI
jgi:hypothetical protein